ncbi:uncharacterized protein Triagg1_4275 [Trichoderma aggressivum f. europaeum]|uniref:Uncharacterized protein n=1 Tax=Trichoderma aggressivum f. europaeum TaxID=173218 RepID=A0AAE1M0H7_9HYPO|nr:hypothetical protein Triagg1_4275 [Trichoderma aggressivum f. europaeum]
MAVSQSTVQILTERHEAQKQAPFRHDQPMIGPPDCSWASIRRPRLRACPLPHSFIWREKLGYGLDGTVWKVEVNGRPYALKVFWDHKPPGGTRYWAFQRECQISALLQTIRAAVENSAEPVYLKKEPKTWKDAVRNLYSFSNEGRLKPKMRDAANSISLTTSSFPRIRECYGWLTISGAELSGLGPKLWPTGVVLDRVKRQMSPYEEYFAILYEFIPPQDDTNAAVDIRRAMQAQIDLFWRAGLCMTIKRSENWKQGILLDMADLVSPWHVEWNRFLYDGYAADFCDGF